MQQHNIIILCIIAYRGAWASKLKHRATAMKEYSTMAIVHIRHKTNTHSHHLLQMPPVTSGAYAGILKGGFYFINARENLWPRPLFG